MARTDIPADPDLTGWTIAGLLAAHRSLSVDSRMGVDPVESQRQMTDVEHEMIDRMTVRVSRVS